ncbi:MAG: hypothetical protein P4L40_14805 [Terracidiphilus sp.]|nr:hypothetical protein [Terracidiphilus sp.]
MRECVCVRAQEFKAMWLIALVSKHVSVVFTLALYCYSGATGHARPSAVGLSNSLSALADGFGLVALQAT